MQNIKEIFWISFTIKSKKLKNHLANKQSKNIKYKKSMTTFTNSKLNN